jgi:hypothetical protein
MMTDMTNQGDTMTTVYLREEPRGALLARMTEVRHSLSLWKPYGHEILEEEGEKTDKRQKN